MNRSARVLAASVCAFLALTVFAQQTKRPGILESDELAKVVPATYFFDDQIAPVQMRNALAIRGNDGHIFAAALVDASGYSSDVQQKYQGLLIASKKISVEGKSLAPGQYGMGFTAEGKFRVMDAGANDVFLVDSHTDQALKRAVPLKALAQGSDFRLYAGKKYVTVKLD
jgi:hypothetical protein